MFGLSRRQFRYAVLLLSFVCYGVMGLTPLAQAASLDIPWAIPKRPSFADNMVVIDDVGKGGANYEFMVSKTQITVQDWVDFLNVADPGNTKGLGLADTNNPHHHPYEYAGYGNWAVKSSFDPGGGFSYSRSVAASLPIDKLSLNQVAHYMNWLATGDINSGAFTFSNSSGNSRISSFNSDFPGPRLPLDSDLVKAMYWDKSQGKYWRYPNGSDSAPSAAQVSSVGTYAANKALYGCWSGDSNYCWARVGEESGNPWGLLDVAGNRHETTLQPTNLTGIIVRGASAYTPISWSDRNSSDSSNSSFSASQYLMSVGYRVWTGVPKPSGKIAVSKIVSGGTDSTRNFSFTLNCDGSLYDKTFTLKHGQTPFVSSPIPQGTKCTVTETAPSSAPAGYTYGTPQYSPAQTITIGNNTTQTITVTNPLQAGTASQGCPVGTVPSPINMLVNGDLAIEPAASDINAFPGRDNTTPGYFYSAANFYSQAQYRGRDALPSDAVAGDWGTVNKFTINKGYVIKDIHFSPGDQDQMPFPGDPANNVAQTDWWFYSNGNALGVGDPSGPPQQEYLLWEQDLNNLEVGKTYTFSAYVSNVLELSGGGADAPDDPIVRLRVGGTTGMPDGTAVFGPYTMPEDETGNTKPLNGWKRVEYAFAATGSSMKFKFTSAAQGITGDDFGLTALGVNECIKSVLNVSKTVNGKPLGFSSPNYTLNLSCSNALYNQTFTLKDGETKTITDIPAGTTCSVTEPSTPVPPSGYMYAPPVISPAVTLNASSPNNINVTNELTWKTGSLSITKQVSGAPSGFTSPDFSIEVDCSDNSFDQTFLLKEGENKIITGIPENTSCSIAEPSIPAAPYGYTYLAPSISPGTVSILGNQTMAVTVTNTLEEMCVVQEDNVLNASSPTYGVEQNNLLANDEYVYMPVLQRSDTPLWSGNLKKFLRKNGHIYNADGTTEAVDSEGKFTNAAKDIWSDSSSADGRDITKGGAANKLPLPDSRNLYTNNPGNNDRIIEMKAPGGGSGGVTPAMFGVTGAAERNNLLDFIRGKNADGTPRYHMGDTLNGQPELVTYGSGTYVFLATNEGYLHAIKADTGVEEWAFMPNTLLKNVKTLYENNQSGVHVAGLDGPIHIWRFQYDKNSNGLIDSNETFTYLYFGLREGGAEYYMLDITNIQAAPSVVWHITSDTSGFVEMGQAWSKPAMAKMRIAANKPENTQTHASELKDVLVFGGGYNNTGIPQGRTVFIVDAMTGELLWSLRDINGATDGLSPATVLTNSIPGNVRVLDMDRNGALDRLYFADTGGNVWRVDMDVDVSDGEPSTADTYYDYRKSRLSKFASLGGTNADNRMFFFEPDVSLMDYRGKTILLLSIGSGNRANALDTSVDDRFYVMVDRNPYFAPNSSLFPITHGSALASIDDTSALGGGLLTNTSLSGWFYELPNTGEKVLASATTVLNKVVFTSFTPGSVTTGATCDQRAAKARAYVVDLFSGKAVADLDRKGGVERSVIAAENEVLDTAQLVFSSPSTVDKLACSNTANCTSQYVEVRVGRMSRPLIDTSNVLVPGVVDGQDMDVGKILPRVFWRNEE